MVDEAFIVRWVERLRATVPEAAAVILKGSYARGDAGPYSDVDFDVLTAGDEREEYPAYLEEIAGRLVHVSVAVRDLPGWRREEAEPAGGLSGYRPARLCASSGPPMAP